MKNIVILTIHNKESRIASLLTLIIAYTTVHTSQLVILLDGCKNCTNIFVSNMLIMLDALFKCRIVYPGDVWETKANNEGLRQCTTDYSVILQDDMDFFHRKLDCLLLNLIVLNKLF